MKRMTISLALLMIGGLAHAADKNISCSVDSKYNISTDRNAFVFSQNKDKPARIVIGGGKLFVDGSAARLSTVDQARITQLESELRQLMPQAKQVALAGIDIAFAALTEVARGLSSDPQSTITSLESARKRLSAGVGSKPISVFDERSVNAIIEPIVTEFVPIIASSAVSMALKAAFASEAERNAMEARMQTMEKDIDKKIEPRAKALEPLAEALCQRLQRMDTIENSLSYRLPNSKALELFTVDHSNLK